MKPRKPKDLAEKPEKPLSLRYSEVIKLREQVKQVQSETAASSAKAKDSG
jgi:hypothetical protein